MDAVKVHLQELKDGRVRVRKTTDTLECDTSSKPLEEILRLYRFVPEIELYNSAVDSLNLEMLSTANHVKILSCSNLTAVAPLRHLNTLELLNCRKVEQLNQLSQVRNLSISWASSLRNLQGLDQIYTLKLEACRSLTGIVLPRSSLHNSL